MEITKETSYLIGLIQTDGHLRESTRNRGSLSIELSYKDKDIIDKIAALIPYNYKIFSRTRNTNFSQNYQSIGLRVCQKEFRDFLKTCNVPIGRKSASVAPPNFPTLSKIDYIRGLIDGDGSLGFSKTGLPFITFTTDSDSLKNYVLDFFNEISNSNYDFHRNKRDNIYNLSFFNEKGIDIVTVLYYNGALALDRKSHKAQLIKRWKRPANMRKRSKQTKWTQEQDQYILTHTIEQSMKKLDRTAQSVKMRLWRLNQNHA